MDIEEIQRRRITRLEDCLDELIQLILNVEEASGIDEQYEARKTLINELVVIKDRLNCDHSLHDYDDD